jgi:hypothetical protein
MARDLTTFGRPFFVIPTEVEESLKDRFSKRAASPEGGLGEMSRRRRSAPARRRLHFGRHDNASGRHV